MQLIEQVGVRWLLRVSPKKQDSMYKDQVLGRIFGLSRDLKKDDPRHREARKKVPWKDLEWKAISQS